MKLLDIMKKYDRCVVRENARLAKIYKMILKESAETEEPLDEEICPDCGNDPCTCDESDNECDECGMIPEDDFIKDDGIEENDMLRNRPHNAHIDDPAGVMSEEDFFGESEEADDEDSTKGKQKAKTPVKKTNESKDDELETESDDKEVISVEEFFAEAEKEAKADDECDEGEEMMSAAEFFANAEPAKDTKKAEVSEEDDDDTEINEEVEIEPDDRMVSATELLPETEEKKLEESLKCYRRKNHRLFNG